MGVRVDRTLRPQSLCTCGFFGMCHGGLARDCVICRVGARWHI